MACSFNRFAWALACVGFLYPEESLGEVFDFSRSFLNSSSECSVHRNQKEIPSRAANDSVFSLSTDFGGDINGSYAKNLCVATSGASRTAVVHSQLVECRTKRSFFLQCQNYVLCRAKTYSPKQEIQCHSMSNGVDTKSFEITQAIYQSKASNWYLGSLLFKALYFHRELVPGKNEDILTNWLSGIELSNQRFRRPILVFIGIVLQRPSTITNQEVQRMLKYVGAESGASSAYEEPRELNLISNSNLESVILQLYQATIPGDWSQQQ